MPRCPECGQRVSRRGRRAEDLAFEILNVRDRLAQYAPRHAELPEACAQGEDFARHLHLAGHGSASAAPLWSRSAKRWLAEATGELVRLIESDEVQATWSPLPRRAVTAQSTNEPMRHSTDVLISA